MKHTLLILYILITSGALVLLNNSLKETQEALKASFEILEHHNDVINDHREAIINVHKFLKGYQS